MKVKDLKQYYIVYKYKDQYHLHSPTESGRLNHKYLCSLDRKNEYFKLGNNKFTSKIEILNQQVQSYLNNLEYDSDYFYPLYTDGIKEELYVHDYMKSLGFKSHYNVYTYNPKNIYNGNTTKIVLSFYGLTNLGICDTYNPNTIDIYLSTGNFSCVSISVNRDFKSLTQGIDGLLKPLLLTESINSFNTTDKMDGYLSNLQKIVLDDHNLTIVDYKQTVKNRLIEIANSIN